jgi:dGTPase
LNLNEDLTEAIALGHDLGHTPFGHVGEEMLDELYPEGFRHSEQSLRVVDILEREGEGLNLTWEVRDGILNHSKAISDILGQERGTAATLEGQACKIADIVAYINHDTEDALRAGIISAVDLPRSAIHLLGQTPSERINTLVSDLVAHSLDRPLIVMSPQVGEATKNLRDFLFEKAYNPIAANKDAEKAREVIRLLYLYLLGHEERLPQEYTRHTEPPERKVVDYIAGMTDQFALRLAQEVGEFK